MALRRKTPLPDTIRHAVPLPDKDKILAHASLSDGAWSVGTRGLLCVVEAGGTGGPHVSACRPWCDVDDASYEPEEQTMTVRWVDTTVPTVLRFADDRNLPFLQTFRERVQSSVVIAETVRLPGGRTARVAVRRNVDGNLFSQVIADMGTNLDDPEVARLVDGAETRVRSAAGLGS